MSLQIDLDDWQKDVLATKGNICLRSGRQVGKSTIIGLKAANFSLNNPNKLIMVISKTERQAGLLFAKILGNIHNIDKQMIKKGKDRPTKHIINLKNGSVIHCLPAGDTGFGIMGFTIDLLIADEAAFIPEEVWNSIIPALAITRGAIWLLSTPFVKEGYYYECFNDPSFTSFHQSSEECPRRDDVFLAHKRATLTEAQYAQMYLGRFVDDFKQFFSDELISKICTGKRIPKVGGRRYFMGNDIAGMGGDEITFGILDGTVKTNIKHIENITKVKQTLPNTERDIIYLDKTWDFVKIGIDDAGLGEGVMEHLLENEQVKRKVKGLHNARKIVDREGHEKRVMKEVMYTNLLYLMQQGYIQLLDDDEIKASLKSVQRDVDTGKISGNYTHIAEGLIRAAWCIKEKSLKLWIDYI